MSNPASPNCPQCGAALPVGAPGGLCPRCLMALNLKTETVFTDDTPAAQPPLPPDEIAPHFPQLEILECLGRGGMGVVYKARQKTLNRFVALKLLAPERVHDAKFAERFAREAQALAALNHPNIVTIHDFGQAGGFYFLLMEFVDGVNLRQLLRARKFTPEEALAIVPPLCDALQFAHERGIVHRDIKPENLLLDKSGRVKVADFGIAKMLGNGGSDPAASASAPDNATKTAMGTPGYSAPEQKSDPQRVDSRADIYSLGVVFYEMLTGELPGQRIEPPSRKVQIDVRLDQVVLRALEKTPELRFQQASEVKTCVETIAATPNPGGSPRAEAQPEDSRPGKHPNPIAPASASKAPDQPLPITVIIIGILFSLVGIACLLDMVIQTRAYEYQFDPAIFCLPVGLGLLRVRWIWRRYALAGVWLGLAGVLFALLLIIGRAFGVQVLPGTTNVELFGWVPTPLAKTWLTLLFVLGEPLVLLWIYRELTRPAVKAVYEARRGQGADRLETLLAIALLAIAFGWLPQRARLARHDVSLDSVPPASIGQASHSAPAYGPVTERILTNEMTLDFATGRLVNQLPDSVKQNGIAASVLAAVDWMKQQRRDALWIESDGLLAEGMEFQQLKNNDWDNGNPADLYHRLAYLNPDPAGHEFLHPPAMGTETIGFKTRSGSTGVLQLTSLPGDPSAVQLRYKLLSGTDSMAAEADAKPVGDQTATYSFVDGQVVITNQIGAGHLRVSKARRIVQSLGDGRWLVMDGTNVVITSVKPADISHAEASQWMASAQSWTNWNNHQEIGSFYAVAATPRETVAVGIDGRIATRDNATGNWRVQIFAGDPDFRGILYAHGQYIVVREQGGIMTSPDGLAWTTRASPVTNNLLGVFWDGHQYLAGGDRGTLLASPDGITWTRRDTGSEINLSAFSYSGTRYVVVGNDGILVSDDAVTWRKPATWATTARVPFIASTWTGSDFLACGLGLDKLPTIYNSPDGETWTLRDTTITASLRAAITVGRAIYVAGDSVVAKSIDGGATWTNIFPQTSDNRLFMGLATDGQNLIAAGFNRNVWSLPLLPTVTVAETWSPSLAPGEKPNLTAIRNDIKTQMDATNYAAASQRQLWYFSHALDNGESDAVRQSFGVMNWAELGKKDPASRQALVDLRDQDLQQFSAALDLSPAFDAPVIPGLTPGSKRSLFDLYQEISALNRTLNDNDGYNAMVTKDPALARHLGYKTADDAFDTFVKQSTNTTGQMNPGNGLAAFDAIRKQWEYLTKAESRVADLQAQTQKHIDAYWAQQSNRPPRLLPLRHPPRAADTIFVDKTRQLIALLVANGHEADAEKILAQALALHDDPWLKSAVTDAQTKLQARVAMPGNP